MKVESDSRIQDNREGDEILGEGSENPPARNEQTGREGLISTTSSSSNL